VIALEREEGKKGKRLGKVSNESFQQNKGVCVRMYCLPRVTAKLGA
jgi:hypothetical protein